MEFVEALAALDACMALIEETCKNSSDLLYRQGQFFMENRLNNLP